MNKIYELLGLIIQHLKTFLCSEEVLTECDSYIVRNTFALRSRRSSLFSIKSKIINTMNKIKKHLGKRPNSVNKGKKKEKVEEKQETNKEKKFFLFDCEEEKVILIFKRYTKLHK